MCPIEIIGGVANLLDSSLDVWDVGPLETIFPELPDQKVEDVSAQAADLIENDVSRESWAES